LGERRPAELHIAPRSQELGDNRARRWYGDCDGIEHVAEIAAMQCAGTVAITPLREAFEGVIHRQNVTHDIRRKIVTVVNQPIEYERLHMLAVPLEVSAGVYGAVRPRICDQTIVQAERLSDTLDICGCVDR
jgi:hypothetical protein